MAGLVPIQLDNATNGQIGPLSGSAGDGEPATGFAAILFRVFNPGNGRKMPFEAVQPPGVGSPEPGSELEPPVSAVLTPPDPQLLGPEGASDAALTVVGRCDAGNGLKMSPSVAVKSYGSGLFSTASGTATTLATGKKLPASQNTPAGDGPARSLSGTLVARTASAKSAGKATSGDDAGPHLDPLKPDDNGLTLPENTNTVTGSLPGAALVLPLGNIRGEGTQDETVVPLLAIAASGKNPGGGDGTHIRGHRLADEHSGPAVQVEAGQVVPDVTLTPVADASQQPVATVCLPIPVPTPLSDATPVVASRIKAADGNKPADPHRPAPVEQGKTQPDGTDHPVGGASPAVLSLTAGDPEKFVVKPGTWSETSALAIRVEVPQATPSGSASPQVSKVDQGQPAAPADQVAPALIGILHRSDGQQSVTVRLQPAELGQVHIRIDQAGGGAAHIDITAERPETLQMLQRDEPKLQQVLDQAGVPTTGRTVSFQVSMPEQIGATASRPDSMETGAGGSGQGQSGGTWRQNGDSANGFGRGPGPDQGQSRPRWYRAGLDITA
jgi:hypothetical protein